MPYTSHRRIVLFGALAIVAAALVAVVLASTSDAAARSATVTLRDGKLSVSPKSVAHGKITFTATNKGDMEHELLVIKTSKTASKLPVSGNRASDKGAVGEVEDIAGGKSKKLTLTLRAGHYVLICNLPGHYKGGMRSSFTVK